MLSTKKNKYQKELFSMNILSSNAHFRQRVIKKSYKTGVTEASKYYRISRNAIYEWRKKYDGKSWKSLLDKSHRPYHHPNEHTQEEKDKILRRYPRYKDDMIMLWDSLRKSGYTRSYYSLVRVVRKWIMPEIKKKSTKKSMPYQRAEYPGQKIQVDVKFVPSYCATNGHKYYQYTAVDECARWTFREIQTDNGKVERQHRTDEKRFYKKMKMYNLEDGRKQLEKYNIKSNNIPKICLGFETPNEVINKYLSVM